MCFLKAFSRTTSFKEFVTRTIMPVYTIHDKGEPRSTDSTHKLNRVSFDVSRKDWSDFQGQILDAIEFLERYFEELKVFIKQHDTDEILLDFPIYSRLDENIANQNDRLPAKLLRLAGNLNIDIEIATYPPNLFEGLRKPEP
jgi:hypothetical protein